MKYRLDDIAKKKEPFSVPDRYFEELPLKVQQKIAEKPRQSVLHLPVWSYATAASVLLLLTTYMLWGTGGGAVDDLLGDISNEDLIAYLQETELDESDLILALEGVDDNELLENIELLNGLELQNQPIDEMYLEYDLEEEI